MSEQRRCCDVWPLESAVWINGGSMISSPPSWQVRAVLGPQNIFKHYTVWEKWTVYKGKSPSKMDDDWRYPHLWQPIFMNRKFEHSSSILFVCKSYKLLKEQAPSSQTANPRPTRRWARKLAVVIEHFVLRHEGFHSGDTRSHHPF